MYGDLSEILTLKQYKEILRNIKSKNPETIRASRLLKLGGEDLSQGNLNNNLT